MAARVPGGARITHVVPCWKPIGVFLASRNAVTSCSPGLDQVPQTAVPLAALPLLPAAVAVSEAVAEAISADPEPMTRALVVVSPSLRLRNTVL